MTSVATTLTMVFASVEQMSVMPLSGRQGFLDPHSQHFTEQHPKRLIVLGLCPKLDRVRVARVGRRRTQRDAASAAERSQFD